MSDLKPCPFCGCTAIYVTHTHYYDDEDTVCMFCNGCKSVVILESNEAEGINDKTRTEATEAWNTRAERTCHITTLGLPLSDFPIGKCSNCGCGADVSSKYCWQCGAKVVEQ